MSNQEPNTEAEPSEDNDQKVTLSQLKHSIHLSTNKLLELTYSEDKYIKTIINFNDQAIEYINRQQQQQALVHLAQAQRTLEYGASCGKSIDRNLIISILNNEACCYYREGQLLKCANYLEGVIYNLKAFGTSMETSPNGSSLLQKQKNKQFDEFYHVSLQKKIELVHYSLRYCTINSQMGKREAALKAGNNVVKLVKGLVYDLLFENPKIYTSESGKPEEEMKELKELMKMQQLMKQEVECEDLETYRRLARVYVKKWNERKISNRIIRDFQRHIRDYSISEVIDILPVQYISNSDSLYENICNTKVILRQLLHISMGYFTISTEHRLLAEYRYPSSLEQKQNSQEWKSANIYHLFGIIFLGVNLNSDLLFMKQLISSYQQHYKFELLIEQSMPDEELQSLSQKYLFEPKTQKRFKQSDILFEKISKLKEKQDTKSSKQKQDRKTNDSKSKNNEYKTLNSTKLNISKDIIPTIPRKRSISKQQTSGLSSKKMSQKISMNNSSVSKRKIRADSTIHDKVGARKRSYSKDSVTVSKKTLNVGEKKMQQVQKIANEYQLETPNKKLVQGQRKRRVSSVSSGKDFGVESHREKGKEVGGLSQKLKQKKLATEHEQMRSPSSKMVGSGAKKLKSQKTKQVKEKKKVNKGENEKEKQQKKTALSKKSYYF